MYESSFMRLIALGAFAVLCLGGAKVEAAKLNAADFIAACSEDPSVTDDPGFDDHFAAFEVGGRRRRNPMNDVRARAGMEQHLVASRHLRVDHDRQLVVVHGDEIDGVHPDAAGLRHDSS